MMIDEIEDVVTCFYPGNLPFKATAECLWGGLSHTFMFSHGSTGILLIFMCPGGRKPGKSRLYLSLLRE